MSLDYTDRDVLEKIIEHEINRIPVLLSRFRDSRIKSKYQITNPEEFCYGHVHGTIITEFTAHYFDTHRGKGTMPDSMMEELGEIIQKRSRDIKTAIFNCG